MTLVKFTLLVAALSALPGCALLDGKFRPARQDSLVATMAEGERAYGGGDWLAARDHFLKVVDRAPRHVPALFRLGNIAQRLNSLHEARERYEKVLKLEPEHAKAHYNLAMVLATLARTHFDQAAGLAGGELPTQAALEQALGPRFSLSPTLNATGSDAR